MLSRLTVVPAMQVVLEALPPKMLRISTDQQPERVRFSENALGSRVDDVYARINGATFTGKGDKEKVPLKYRAYATAISAALTDVLVLRAYQRCLDSAACRPPRPSLQICHRCCSRP